MSEDWVRDISGMHRYYGVNEKVQDFDADKLKQFLRFRMSFLDEELTETKNAVNANDAEEIAAFLR